MFLADRCCAALIVVQRLVFESDVTLCEGAARAGFQLTLERQGATFACDRE